MADPIPGVTYHRTFQDQDWKAPGRASLPGTNALYPSDTLFPSDVLYPAGA